MERQMLPHGWRELCTPSGQPLYYCVDTHQTTWQPPVSPPESPPACCSSPGSQCSESSSPAPSSAASLPGAASPPTRFPTPRQRFPTAPGELITHTKPNSHTSHPSRRRPSGDESERRRYTLPTLVERTRSRARGYPLFELERDKVLQINLGSTDDRYVWIRSGCMIARKGKVHFSRQGFRDEGISNTVKRAFTGEGLRMSKCEGRGTIYCAMKGRAVCVVQLDNQSLSVNGDMVLALSASLRHEVKVMKSAGMTAIGLFYVKVSGSGFLAFMCEKSAITLEASATDPVYTDADATVAWTHDPTLKLDLSLRLVTGRRSGQELQLKFGAGVVIVQPFETSRTLLPDRALSMGANMASLTAGALHGLHTLP